LDTGYRILTDSDLSTAWMIQNSEVLSTGYRVLANRDTSCGWRILASVTRGTAWRIFTGGSMYINYGILSNNFIVGNNTSKTLSVRGALDEIRLDIVARSVGQMMLWSTMSTPHVFTG
jgi:hypothetical protein